MLFLLVWVPAGASAILGVVFVFCTNARPWIKIFGILVFALAIYLQFFSPFGLAGLLLQTALALTLALWRRFDAVV